MNITSCKICGSEFKARNSCQNYCSKECYIKNKDVWRKNNPDKVKESKQRYYSKNKEKLLEKQKTYRQDNQEKYKEYLKEWNANNKKHCNEYQKKRKSTNENYRLAANIRSRLSKTLKIQSTSKNQKTIDILGCNIEDYKIYLESKFLPGMSWDNYGLYGWHIDHIIPICSFDLTNEEELKKAFHYTNTQPLWAEDNLKKGGTF